jgi:hypothetical protein
VLDAGNRVDVVPFSGRALPYTARLLWRHVASHEGMDYSLSSISCNVKSPDFGKNVINTALACPLASSGQNLDHVESMRIPHNGKHCFRTVDRRSCVC